MFYLKKKQHTSLVILPLPSKSYRVNDHSCLSEPATETPHSNSCKEQQNTKHEHELLRYIVRAEIALGA